MSDDDNSPRRPRARLATRVGRGLSFMNKLALLLLIAGLVALAFRHS